MAILAALSVGYILGIVYAGLGLGFVIFVHELGHFLVAKWCGVRVERFSIGFGPVLWSVIRGETEYALSIIPFGGYVKMLGQDDADPNQMASSEIAQDPRSYTSKTVPQRMAIISAGVIMNIITGALMFGLAFWIGLEDIPNYVGATSPGSPAWQAGLQPGDQITRINGYKIHSFTDITRRVTLSWNDVEMLVKRRDGKTEEFKIQPQRTAGEGRNTIGVAPAEGLELVHRWPAGVADGTPPADGGTAATKANPPLALGDIIVKVAGKPVKDWFEMREILAANRSKTIELEVHRGPNPGSKPEEKTTAVKTKIPPNPFRTLGLKMDLGQVSAIRKGSPADGRLQPGDKITHVKIAGSDEREIGLDLNPLRLPDYLAQGHGKEALLKVKREKSGAEPETLEIKLVPDNRAGWSEYPFSQDAPMSIPAIGVTCYVLHTVLAVEPGSPAAGQIKPQDQLKSATLTLPKNALPDGYKEELTVPFGDEERNWPWLFWLMQTCPQRTLKLKVSSAGTAREIAIAPAPAKDWYTIDRGIRQMVLVQFEQDSSLGEALPHGVVEAGDRFKEIYIVLYSLFTGRLSFKQLNGPIGIVGSAVEISQQGFGPLLFFLAYLSINLAVLNFLPIPILDGGHMVFLIYEGIRGKPASERVLIAATYVGLALVLMLMVSVLFLDIGRFF